VTAIAACRTCGTVLLENARFCHGCGAPVQDGDTRAEYKQVTVLFADVVHSMDIASAVGAERLREIMADLADRSAAVVQRYEGTVDKFTGDGIMAVFGAPVALEDHAIRACLAALGVQEETAQLAAEVKDRDGIDLLLRVGLNSGQVIAGEIGSGPFGYTAVGEQVGMAQRIESVAPPGGVMLSASTARLVEGVATVGESELVRIKGADKPVAARRLLGMGEQHRGVDRAESKLVGRRWEMSAVEGLLDRAIDGHGAVVEVVGPPGIGKSRLGRECTALAGRRGVGVFTAFCESHASQVPFHAVARLVRAAIGVEGLDGQTARERVRDRVPDADPEDLLLLDDLLGIADPNAQLPAIDPDARRRRLKALLNAASLARETPAVFLVEDAHWIDEVSESMIADFLTVIPQTPSLVLVTYRPEYQGALTRAHGAQTIALAPLSDSETLALVSELLGPDLSNGALGQGIAERAAGNPFFAEEMVRELAERGVLQGQTGAYVSTADFSEAKVPATLQATIGARIDRLDPAAKRTLSAAAVIGSRFSRGLLETLGIEPILEDLVVAELVDQVRFTRGPEFVFHHPLIRTVAYESQLKSDRAELHRRVAVAIEQQEPDSADENAVLIAEHLEAACDGHAAYGWHMRAAAWATNRDITAARLSWQRAQQIADAISADDPDRAAMRIAPRTLLCASAWRAGVSLADTGFDELRELATAAGDNISLAMGMAGWVSSLLVHGRYRESSRLATECENLINDIGDPALVMGLLYQALGAKVNAGETTEVLRMAQRIIDLSADDPAKGNLIIGSPLIIATMLRGVGRACLGDGRWRDDVDHAATMVRTFEPAMRALVLLYKYFFVSCGVILPDEAALRETAEILELAERCGDDFTLASAQFARGLCLVRHDGQQRGDGFDLLARAREASLKERLTMLTARAVESEVAKEMARTGDLTDAIEVSRAVVDDEFDTGEMLYRAPAVMALVESLLQRATDADLQEAQAAVNRLAATPTEPGFVWNEICLLRLRALLARAHGDTAAYTDFRDRYRDMARTLGFEGHTASAEVMP
jgi:adenylate cyclase